MYMCFTLRDYLLRNDEPEVLKPAHAWNLKSFLSVFLCYNQQVIAWPDRYGRNLGIFPAIRCSDEAVPTRHEYTEIQPMKKPKHFWQDGEANLRKVNKWFTGVIG